MFISIATSDGQRRLMVRVPIKVLGYTLRGYQVLTRQEKIPKNT